MSTVNVNIFIRAAAAPMAQQLMEAVDGDAAKNTLSVPLVPTGSPPGTQPTWYAASGALLTERLPLLTDAQALVEATGGAVDLVQAEWLLSMSDVTEIATESFEQVCERLGVEIQKVAI